MPTSHEAMRERVMPLKPTEILPAKLELMPAAVMQVFNELIASKFSNGSATVLQKDVVNELVALGLKRNEIFKNHWLDVEEIYEEAGWQVTYDKPGYNEDYEESFEFTDASKGRR